MRKILFIISQSEFGGAQRYVYDLATHLKDYRVSVAAGGKDELFEKLAPAGLGQHRLKYLKRQINPYYDGRAFFEIRNLIKKEKPDIIHLNSTKAGFLGALAALGLDTKVIYTAHGWVFNEPLKWWLKKLYFYLEKWSARWKDKIICVSEHDRQIALKRKLAEPEKLITIHNGLDTEKLKFLSKEEARAALHINQNLFTIGCIAHFYPTKGLKYLIEAALFLKSPYQIIIIGEGRERKNLEKQITDSRLKNKIILLGARPEAARYLKAFDIFVLPSLKEGFPYALLESLAAGRPIVSTLTGGIPEIIENNQNGFLAPIKDARALAEKITQIIENPGLAQKFSQNNLERIKEFNLEKMLEATKQVY